MAVLLIDFVTFYWLNKYFNLFFSQKYERTKRNDVEIILTLKRWEREINRLHLDKSKNIDCDVSEREKGE